MNTEGNKVYPGVQQPNQPTVVVINQGEDPNADYRIPGGVCPGAFMIVIAIVNLIVFVVVGVLTTVVWDTQAIAAFILYLIVGALAAGGGARKQDNKGCAIACLIFAIFCLICAFVQVIVKGLGVAAGGLVMAVGQQVIGAVIFYTNIALLVLAFIALALSITLIVLPSKVLCCRKPSGGAVIMHNNGVQNAGHTQVIQY
ncbi:uncharacterized protein LOC135487774 [Lineus longissimus]|uniref:uncharacterized protein LOC135487774 n=1 Tax=Lineus longissimus TaxID=88925 RepID=UPI00315CA577